MTHRWLPILVLSIFLLVRSSAFAFRLLIDLNRNGANSDAALRRLTSWRGCAHLAASTQEGAIAEGDADSEVEGDVDSEVGNGKKFSKVKWKRKRYLIMQDVKKRIQKEDPHAPRKAQEMVRRMWNLYEKSGDDLDYKPTLQAYNLWIHALARSGLDQAGHLAEEVLEEMKSTGIEPDVITYTSVMDAHAKSQSSQRAEKVLFDLLDETAKSSDLALTTITCDTFLNAMAQIGTREAAERAQDILLRLEHFQNEAIRPTKVSYSTVITAWAKVGSGDAAEKAEALLQRMLRPSSPGAKGGDQVVRPDTIVYNAVINCWATSGDPMAGTKALALLNEMKEFAENEKFDTRPDIVTYNTVLSAWSHSGDENAAPFTDKILQEMQRASEKKPDTAPAPNTVSYNTVLDAWSKSTLPGAALRAQKVLEYMLRSDNKCISPDVISFTSVLNALAKSKEPNKGVRARELMDKLVQLYRKTKDPSLRPTQIPYNTVLNACAFSAVGTTMDEQREALQVAVSTLTDMRAANVAPDTVTYGNMLKCFSNLMPQGEARSNMAIQIFQKCCEEGQVGGLAWNEVRRAVPNDLLARKLNLKGSPGGMQLRDLPKKWRRRTQLDKNGPSTTSKTPTTVLAGTPKDVVSFSTRMEASYESGKDL